MEADAPSTEVSPSSPPPRGGAGRRSRAGSRSSIGSGTSGGGGGSGSNSIEYISLRDVLVEGGGGGGGGGGFGFGGGFGSGGGAWGGGSWREYSCNDIHDFDASNIGIRNQLLKHAASAYLQSAVVVPPRDHGCLARLWRYVQLRARGGGGGRGRGRVLMRACSWQGCVDDPAELCAAFIARSARRIAAFLAGFWA